VEDAARRPFFLVTFVDVVHPASGRRDVADLRVLTLDLHAAVHRVSLSCLPSIDD